MEIQKHVNPTAASESRPSAPPPAGEMTDRPANDSLIINLSGERLIKACCASIMTLSSRNATPNNSI